MRRELIVEPEAEADLQLAYRWYESQRAGLGIEFLEQAERTFDAITLMPESYVFLTRNLRRARMKRFPYFVMFVETLTHLVVIGVFHSRQNPQEWEKRAQRKSH